MGKLIIAITFLLIGCAGGSGSSAQAVDGRIIYNTTPNGAGTAFSRIWLKSDGSFEIIVSHTQNTGVTYCGTWTEASGAITLDIDGLTTPVVAQENADGTYAIPQIDLSYPSGTYSQSSDKITYINSVLGSWTTRCD